MTDITQLLHRIESGDPQTTAELLSMVYEELRRLAEARLARERSGQTLQASALVHEAYLRLVGDDSDVKWNGRRHFFGAAAQAMRRILVERARMRQTEKRGGQRERIQFTNDVAVKLGRDERLLDLDDALARLAELDPAKARLVELRFFVGLTNREAAEHLDISAATADRYWSYARAWLKREMS